MSLALLAVICVFGALVVILAVGRLNLDLLKPAIVAALNQRVGPAYQLDISELSIERQHHGLALALQDFAISRSDGRKLVTAPKADLIFDPLQLLGGQFRPSRVELEDLHVELHVLPDGGVDLSAADLAAPQEKSVKTPEISPASPAAPQISVAPPTSAPTAPRAKIIRQAAMAINSIFDMAAGDSPFAALDHFGVSRGSLVIDDQVAGQKRGFQDFQFSLDRSRPGGREAVEMKISALGPSGRWSVHGATHGARAAAHDLSFEASGFSIDEIALLAGKTSLPVDSDIPVSFKAAASFEAGGHVAEANARVSFGSGFWRFDDPDFAPVFIDEVFAAAHWDASTHRAAIDEAQIFSGETRFFLNGVVTPPPADGAPWTIAFKQTEPGVIGPDRAGEKSLSISSFHGEIDVDPAAKTLTIGRTELVGPEVAAAAQGTLDWTSGPHLRLGVAASKSTAAAALALWPNAAGAPVRGWMGDHLIGGTLESLRLAVDFDETDLRMMRAQHPPMSDRISIDYAVKDAAFTFLDGAPPVTGLNASGHSSGRATRLTASTGAMEAGPGRRIDFSDGVIAFPNAEQKPPEMSVSARGKGSLDALGELLAKPAFARVASLPIDPKTTKGQFDGTFTYRTKLTAEYDPKLSSIDVAARVENFSADHVVGKEKLESAILTVNVAGGNTHIVGAGKILGAPATVELTRSGDEAGQGLIAFSIDEAGRAKAGLPFGASVAGPVGVKIAGQIGALHPQAQIELDLTKTGLNYPAPGFFKPPGRAAKATFAYREDERGGATLDQIVYDGSGQMAKGTMQLGADGGLVSAKFGQIRFSPGDSLEIEAVRTGDRLKIVARGAAVDARPFLKSIGSPSDSAHPGGEFDLDMSATLLSGANRQLISNAELHMSRKGNRLQALDFSGMQGGDKLKGELKGQEEASPVLRVTTSDAGALLAFLDIYGHMEGGRLTCDLRLADGGLSGPLDIENFTLRGEPAMRSFANAPNNEQFSSKFKIDPNVVAFARLHALLDKKNGRLTIRDGTIASPNIGSTLEGWIDFDRDAMDLTGVFVPAYGVNNLFGQLPVLGLVLGGGDQEGLIGLNYRVTGRPSAPVLSVNPLSAIAPGFLRKIFGVLPP